MTPVEHESPPKNLVVSTSPAGEHRIWVPARGIVATCFVGRGTIELARGIKRDMMPILEAESPAAVYADWQGMTGYESEARIELTAWMKSVRPHMRSFSVLVRSRVVAMGVSVANLALGGGLRSFTSTTAFRRALDAAIAGIPSPA
jgi:hypothetical protein